MYILTELFTIPFFEKFKMNIDVGIINYNGGDELIDCVRSLVMQTMPVRIFVFCGRFHFKAKKIRACLQSDFKR